MLETDSVVAAKEFLKKQKHSLHQRQASLQAARRELDEDVVRHRLAVGKLEPSILTL